MPRQCTVFLVVYPCCLIQETLVWPLDFRCYLVFKLRFVQQNFHYRHLGFLTSAYLLAVYYHCYNTSGMSTHEYSGLAVRISFLAIVKQEINHVFKFFTVFIYNFRFWAAILAKWWVVNLFWSYHLVALLYSGKVTKALPLTPSGYEMASERMAWGGVILPPFNIWGLMVL